MIFIEYMISLLLCEWHLLTRHQRKVSVTQLTVRARGPLVLKCSTYVIIDETFHRVKMKIMCWELNFFTINLNFTDSIECVAWISNRIWWMGSVIEIDDISSIVRTNYHYRIWYRGVCIDGVSEAKNPVLLVGRVWYVDGKPQKELCEFIVFI